MSFKDILSMLKRSTCDEVPATQLAVLQKASLMLRKSGILERCLQTGETAPNFSIPLHCRQGSPQQGKSEPESLYDLLERGPVVLNFYRGSWCVFCRAELQAFEDILPELQARGATCLAVSPQSPDFDELETDESEPVEPEKQARPALYPEGMLLHDHGNDIARAFGVLYPINKEFQQILNGWGINLPERHGTDRWELPLAATYVIAPNRSVVFSYVDVDFRKRFDPKLLLEHLPFR